MYTLREILLFTVVMIYISGNYMISDYLIQHIPNDTENSNNVISNSKIAISIIIYLLVFTAALIVIMCFYKYFCATLRTSQNSHQEVSENNMHTGNNHGENRENGEYDKNNENVKIAKNAEKNPNATLHLDAETSLDVETTFL